MKTAQLNRKHRGQGMTEYIIIVALIAIAAIGVITLFGDNIRALFDASSEALHTGQDVKVKTTGKQQGMVKKNLSNFAEKNQY